MTSGFYVIMWNRRDQWGKWHKQITLHTKAGLHPKKWCCGFGMIGRESSIISPSGRPSGLFQQVLLPSTPPESSTQLKTSGNIQQKTALFHQIMQDCMFLWWPGKNLELGWKVDSSGIFSRHCAFGFPFTSIFTEFSWWKKISIPWKIVKCTWKSSLLKKIKSFRKMELWRCLENGRCWNKTVNMLFNKVLGEYEKCVLFLLKSQRNFLTNPAVFRISHLFHWWVTW